MSKLEAPDITTFQQIEAHCILHHCSLLCHTWANTLHLCIIFAHSRAALNDVCLYLSFGSGWWRGSRRGGRPQDLISLISLISIEFLRCFLFFFSLSFFFNVLGCSESAFGKCLYWTLHVVVICSYQRTSDVFGPCLELFGSWYGFLKRLTIFDGLSYSDTPAEMRLVPAQPRVRFKILDRFADLD